MLLDLLGNPQLNIPVIHVAGTNGKGSTVSYIATVLAKAGYRVGKFISPYIERFTERISVSEVEISEEEVAELIPLIKEKIDIMLERGDAHPTEFEIVTALDRKSVV